MKTPDKALPSFLTGATLSAVLALSGFPFVAAAVLLIAYMVAMDYWQPVRDGEDESRHIQSVRNRNQQGRTVEDWLLSLDYEGMKQAEADYRAAGLYHSIFRWYWPLWSDLHKYSTTKNETFREVTDADVAFDVAYRETKMKEERYRDDVEKAIDETEFDIILPSPTGSGSK